MTVQTVLIYVLLVVVLILLVRYIRGDVAKMTGLANAQTLQMVSTGSLGTSSNYGYSIWLYVDDWNYRFGEEKIVFARTAHPDSISADACPVVSLDAGMNSLTIRVATMGTSAADVVAELFPISVRNIPLQRWVNLTMSVYTRVVDVYLDGKLVRTAMLPSVASIQAAYPAVVTPGGGFAGWTSHFQYIPDAVNPQQAMDIYIKGYGGSWLGALFGSTTVKLSLQQGDVETAAVVI